MDSMDQKIQASIDNSKKIKDAKQVSRASFDTGLGGTVEINERSTAIQIHVKPDTFEERFFNLLVETKTGIRVDYEDPKHTEPFSTITLFLCGMEVTLYGKMPSNSYQEDNQLQLFDT